MNTEQRHYYILLITKRVAFKPPIMVAYGSIYPRYATQMGRFLY